PMRRVLPSGPTADLPPTADPGPPPLDRPGESEAAVQVEAAESELSRLGLEHLRVHHHRDLARIEAPHAGLSAATTRPRRGEALRAGRPAGFGLVARDLGAPGGPAL